MKAPRGRDLRKSVLRSNSETPLAQGWVGVLLSGTQCLSFRDMFPFLVKEASQKISKEEHAKVLAMEIYALLMTANRDLVKCVLEEVKTYFIPP